jgi:hypothetical protein
MLSYQSTRQQIVRAARRSSWLSNGDSRSHNRDDSRALAGAIANPTTRLENIRSDSDSYVAEHLLESAENAVMRRDENVTPNSHFARDRALAPPSV